MGDIISRKLRRAFREAFVSSWYLGQIKDAFEDEGIMPGALAENQSYSGERRVLTEQYYASVDWSNASSVAKVLRVYESFLAGCDPDSEIRQTLLESLRSDGYDYHGGRVVQHSAPTVVLKQQAVNPNLCFVLMPFNEAMDQVYGYCIKPMVEECGLDPLRADEIYGSTSIIEDIQSHIREAAVVIADLTGKNPNVMYELGYADAFGKTVIIITQDMEDVPFDVRHRRCLIYRSDLKGTAKLGDQLGKSIVSVVRAIGDGGVNPH
jgi:hypothetical protein